MAKDTGLWSRAAPSTPGACPIPTAINRARRGRRTRRPAVKRGATRYPAPPPPPPPPPPPTPDAAPPAPVAELIDEDTALTMDEMPSENEAGFSAPWWPAPAYQPG